MKENIDLKDLAQVRNNYEGSTKDTILRHALSVTPMNQIATSYDSYKDHDFSFSVDIKTLPVSNQKHSGRCWIFSASTILREIINRKLHVKDQFEISQNYISYFDKLEKFNYYFQNVLNLTLEGYRHDDRKMAFLLQGVGDGGQWDMYVDLIKKYGIVPKSVFPETEQSNNTNLSTRLGNAALRKFASEISKMKEEGKSKEEMLALKGEYMKKIYALLSDCFGLPPEKFDFEFVDEKNQYHIIKDLTPKSFFETYVGSEIDEYVSLIHAPTKDKEYYQTYHVELVGNVYDGKPITHLNLPFERLEELIINQLKAGEVVWFGSDVSYYGDRPNGSWSDAAFDYETPFGLDFKFDKADMLDFGHSAMNHAMVITGVDLKEEKPVRWEIEKFLGR